MASSVELFSAVLFYAVPFFVLCFSLSYRHCIAVFGTTFNKFMVDLHLEQMFVGTLYGTEIFLSKAVWANNGDMISRQYAGTNALKGDYTRTGERNLSGLVKDGVNSASRYYLNHMRDTYRQAALDVLTAGGLSDDMLTQIASGEQRPGGGGAATAAANAASVSLPMSAEQVRTVIEDCQRMLVPDASRVLGCWGLIDADETSGEININAIGTGNMFIIFFS